MLSSVDLAHYGVSGAKDWVSVNVVQLGIFMGKVKKQCSRPLKIENENLVFQLVFGFMIFCLAK